jgi:hypothetical protein
MDGNAEASACKPRFQKFFSRSFLTHFVLKKKGKPPSEYKLTADLMISVLPELHLRQMRLVDQACSAPKRKMILD